MSTIKKIGTTVYLLNKGWKKTNFRGARLLTGKIKGYQNIEGAIVPIIEVKGKEVSAQANYIFYDLEQAMEKLKVK